jgi:hypothetical protein
MTPIDSTLVAIAHLLSVLLPQLVGKEESDDEQRQQEKRTKYPMLDHDASPVQVAGATTTRLIVDACSILRCGFDGRGVGCCSLGVVLVSLSGRHASRHVLAVLHVAASTPAPTSMVPPVRLTTR